LGLLAGSLFGRELLRTDVDEDRQPRKIETFVELPGAAGGPAERVGGQR
jgi:hypothetical protein